MYVYVYVYKIERERMTCVVQVQYVCKNGKSWCWMRTLLKAIVNSIQTIWGLWIWQYLWRYKSLKSCVNLTKLRTLELRPCFPQVSGHGTWKWNPHSWSARCSHLTSLSSIWLFQIKQTFQGRPSIWLIQAKINHCEPIEKNCLTKIGGFSPTHVFYGWHL